MANAINTLLSLRDTVRIKNPWSSQSSASQSLSAALNLGIFSNPGSILPDIESSPPQINHSTNGGKILHDPHNRRSPRVSPKIANSISPTRTNSGNHHNYSGHSNGINGDDFLTPAQILDELTYLYPQEDFTLLRTACMKNEITLTKLSRGLGYNHHGVTTTSPTSGHSNGNVINGRAKNDFMTQQTMQLIKQQNEYVQMLQESGVNLPVFPSDMTMAGGLNLSKLSDSHHTANSKYPAWFHQLAQSAAAAGIALPTGNGTTLNGKKKNGDHLFLSPKTPAISSTKLKTVAAALAASRHSPNTMNNLMANGKPKKPTLPRKRQQRHKPSTITRSSLTMLHDDLTEPSSMVETTINTSPEYGLDLTTNIINNNNNNEFPLEKQLKTEPIEIPPMTATENSSYKANGHNLLNAASLTLENYLRNVLPSNKSPHYHVPDVDQPVLSESDKAKQQVLDAYNEDAEVAGDARGVARKFGLNIRVVLKWLREGPSKSLPALPTAHGITNGVINSLFDSGMIDGLNLHFSGEHVGLLTNGDSHTSGPFSNANHIQKKNLPNKRKNTKPNQICDFSNDDLPDDPDTVPLDMAVPIKKRRVSNSNSS